MEYGDDEVRVLTELEGKRQRWDFVLDDEEYGELVCSYYPLAEEENYFWFYDERGRKNICLGNGYHKKAMEVMQEKIKGNLHTAMIGLQMETRLDTLRQLNGHSLALGNFDEAEERSEIREHYNGALNKRMGAKSGRTPDPMDFLRRVYEAYRHARTKDGDRCRREYEKRRDVLPKVKSKVLRWVEFVGNEYVAQEKLAAEINNGKGILKNKLSDQTHYYGYTHKRLMMLCAQIWEEERKGQREIPLKEIISRVIDRGGVRD